MGIKKIQAKEKKEEECQFKYYQLPPNGMFNKQTLSNVNKRRRFQIMKSLFLHQPTSFKKDAG